MNIVFFGDSITDSERKYEDETDLGAGYVSEVARRLQEQYPERSFRFWNAGVAGNGIRQLEHRMERDVLSRHPAFVSILVGVNDILYRHREDGVKYRLTDEEYEESYRNVLKKLKSETNAKILIIEPYLLKNPDRDPLREELSRMLEIVRRLAFEYADGYLPLDGLLTAEEVAAQETMTLSKDGVHPNEKGISVIARHYLQAAAPLLKSI